MESFKITQNDTSPPIRGDCLSGTGQPVDVTGATVKFYMRELESDVLTVDGSGSVVDGQAGTIGYAWAPGDTSSPGVYLAEFEVTYPGGDVETFPSQQIPVRIRSELG